VVPVFHPRLVNDPFDDPCLYIDMKRERRAILFDLGSIEGLEAARVMKVSDVFVSHTHVDHFIGFDHLLRLLLGRDKILRVFGPPGIIRNVEGKLSAYTWNLVEEYKFGIEVYEVSEESISKASFISNEWFVRREGETTPFRPVVLEEPLFSIEVAHLDHKVPSLAFSIKEKFHININKDMLIRLDLPVGPWLNDLKRCFREERPMGSEFTARWKRDGRCEERSFILGDLIENRLVIITRGQKVTYVVDAIGSRENRERIVRLASGSDTFFCEAAFTDEDRDKALEKYHLTAREAGEMAREAGVQRLEIFHFSPKYRENPSDLYEEAFSAFRHGAG
jgi:ribonuclease Z